MSVSTNKNANTYVNKYTFLGVCVYLPEFRCALARCGPWNLVDEISQQTLRSFHALPCTILRGKQAIKVSKQKRGRLFAHASYNTYTHTQNTHTHTELSVYMYNIYIYIYINIYIYIYMYIYIFMYIYKYLESPPRPPTSWG